MIENTLNGMQEQKIRSIIIALVGMGLECFFVWSMSHLAGSECTVIFIVVHLMLTLIAVGSIEIVKGE